MAKPYAAVTFAWFKAPDARQSVYRICLVFARAQKKRHSAAARSPPMPGVALGSDGSRKVTDRSVCVGCSATWRTASRNTRIDLLVDCASTTTIRAHQMRCWVLTSDVSSQCDDPRDKRARHRPQVRTAAIRKLAAHHRKCCLAHCVARAPWRSEMDCATADPDQPWTVRHQDEGNTRLIILVAVPGIARRIEW